MKIVYLSSVVSLFFVLNGCQTIGGWADNAGDHLPVVGERCEHWQCFTSSGKEISDKNIQPQSPQAPRKVPLENPI